MLFQPFFSLPGYHIYQLEDKNLDNLQVFLKRCSDYIMLVSGHPPEPTAASSLLKDCPDGKTAADKIVIGINNEKHILIGVLDAIRDYPISGCWWLGLLLLDPTERCKGLGRRIYNAFQEWVRYLGAEHILLGVVEENKKAYKFWLDMGFVEAERQSPRQVGNKTQVIITLVRSLSKVDNARN